jgi:hypothetical protein
MTMNKLEECARAVDCRPWLEDFGGNDATREALRKHSFAVARAVIRCLMEPNDEMKKAGTWEISRADAMQGLIEQAGDVFRAMLQSVLDEAGEK